ncbi:VWA domain-containing protein [Agrobacterium vitis]|uniref:vWA domain-containing protein n=1 Tax=Rhizobium/Agrobacterium group TaxID=227290 RepID=UPI0008DC16E6|nr:MULTISPECIES: VWA domain-containing protein [Rhizobium/Agrobacterium group]MCF1436010.1 VWA domain-containing protein [Allorhizobium ampelinum]MUO89209.1 VWA domain-containing protein [Agrobacterium vitis]MUZ52680.1 VWA domain-containing protein [Agrobacterium vitis]MUZ92133.1 VWA domain-containing protein [Agrobacterium vitis]MVA41789.1 VWA domain-containing protein [Agrobacterium vitis]
MFLPFFLKLKQEKVPVSLGEYLALLEGVERGLVDFDIEAFYYLARTTLIKDERHIDRFDLAFAECFRGLEATGGPQAGVSETALPEEWLRKLTEKHLSEEDKKLIEAMGGFDRLMETLKQRLAEQKERHQGGSKWIGTAGTSPFGAYGYNPEGVRIGQDGSRHRRAVKVWDQREFRNLDDSVALGTRNIKVALRRLRRFVRQGAPDEFDLSGTIRATAEHGYLDIKTQAERRNAVKLLMFFDIGGSMDDHVKGVEELFSAARSEFRHMEHFYFHNCLYERVWKDNRRRRTDVIPTEEIIRTYGPDYRVIFVGDAAMSPYEITMIGGSVEHWNGEPGAVWLSRITAHFRKCLWLNPMQQEHWDYTHSIGLISRLMGGRMHPLTLGGLEDAARELSR